MPIGLGPDQPIIASRSRATARGVSRVSATATLIAAGLTAGATVIATNSERVIEQAFGVALSRTGLAGPAAVPSIVTVGNDGGRTVNSTSTRNARLDGVSGSESFWLGAANPEAGGASFIGQSLTWRSIGEAERHLVIVDVRKIAASKAAPARSVSADRIDDTRIDLSVAAAPADGRLTALLIICHDRDRPGSGEIHFRLENGEISLAGGSALQML